MITLATNQLFPTPEIPQSKQLCSIRLATSVAAVVVAVVVGTAVVVTVVVESDTSPNARKATKSICCVMEK